MESRSFAPIFMHLQITPLWKRYLNFGSFCGSSAIGGLTASNPDVIYCIIPPLPLGLASEFIGLLKRAPVVVNVQDIYPDIAVALGILRNRYAISIFRSMERFIYRHAKAIVVISEGFKENLLNKGVNQNKVHIVPNWADPNVIRPISRKNLFREELGVGNRFTLIYSGTLSHNSNLEPMIEAADILKNEPFAFVLIGEGVKKATLMQMSKRKRLTNVQFLPFQPLETYSQVLAAADMNLVTLNTQASFASVPSKLYKAMASGRPIMAVTVEGNEIHRLMTQAQCGLCVPPDNGPALAQALKNAVTAPDRLVQWGNNARNYLLRHFSRDNCVTQIENILLQISK